MNMNRKKQRDFGVSLCFLAAFSVWTAAIQCVDVQAIGPQKSAVGLATINQAFHTLTGVHMALYTLTDWLSLVPLIFAIGFGVLGFVQWITRKNLLQVDYSILVLGGFYMVVMGVYALFEVLAVNYRPVLILGILEASYPSSTTMLVMCILPTSIMQLQARIKNKALRQCICSAMTLFTVIMVIGRLISGVHWLTDIIGGALLSAGLVLLYRAVIHIH